MSGSFASSIPDESETIDITDFLRTLVEDGKLTSSLLKDRNKLNDFLVELSKKLNDQYLATLKKYTLTVEEDVKNLGYQIRIQVVSPLKTKNFKIGTTFSDSHEFSDLMNQYDGIKKYLKSQFSLRKAGNSSTHTGLPSFSEFVTNDGKQGAYIQRYKGLGEMNPEQLWETTMNPENRTLLQVKIEDTIDADQVFSVLMGDQVDPRREFVETNALNVRNLDI